MTSESKPEATIFKYAKPELGEGKIRTHVRLCRTDRLYGNVQVMQEGGENRLHYHDHFDGMWMVLGGRVRFYGEGNKLLADLGKHEGIMVPRTFRYWFESASTEPLELLQVEACDQSWTGAGLGGIAVDETQEAAVSSAG